jgi:hypothetical protein
MAVRVICPECGVKNSFTDEAANSFLRCTECGATLAGEEKRPKKKKKPDESAAPRMKKEASKGKVRTSGSVLLRLSESEAEEAIARGKRGVDFMILAAAASLAATIILLIRARTEHPPAWMDWAPLVLAFVSPVALCAPLFIWLPIAERIERREVVNAGFVLLVVIPTLAVAARILGSPVLEGVVSELNWVFGILLVAFLEKVCIIADREDLRDTAQLVLRMGVGVIFFNTVAGILAILPLMFVFAAFALFVAKLCFIYWFLNYARLLVWSRTTL